MTQRLAEYRERRLLRTQRRQRLSELHGLIRVLYVLYGLRAPGSDTLCGLRAPVDFVLIYKI